MAFSRYSFVGTVNNGKTIATTDMSSRIFYLVDANEIGFVSRTLEGEHRLDTLAGEIYGDSSYWWIIAAASGIGWNIQVPAGTLIRIPTNLSQILNVVR